MPNETAHTEKELLLRMAAGEEGAFKIIFHQYFRRLCFFANSLIENADDAKDIAQEALYQAWTRRSNFQTGENLKSFLYISARNASLNYLKSEQRRTARHNELAMLIENQDDLVEVSATREELLHEILIGLESVPPKYADVLKLIFIEGLNYEQVAEKLSIPAATVRKQKERGLKFLQSAVLRKKLLAFVLLVDSPFS